MTLELVSYIYCKAEFIVQMLLIEMEFEKLKNLLPNNMLYTTAAREHVGEIKRKLRVIEE